MKKFQIALIGAKGETLTPFKAVVFEVNQTKVTKQIAEYLQQCESNVVRYGLKSVILELTNLDDATKTVDVKYTSNLLTTSFAVLKALPKIVFSATAKSTDIHIKSKSEILLHVAAIFNLKRDAVTYNEFLSAIVAKEDVKKALVYTQKQGVRQEVLSDDEQAVIADAKQLRKDIKAQSDSFKKLSSTDIKAKVQQYYLTVN